MKIHFFSSFFSPIFFLALLLSSGCGDGDANSGVDGGGPDGNEPTEPEECSATEFFDESAGECTPWTECAPGEAEETPPTATSDRICTACRAGDECLGGDSPRRRCGWLDHDSDPSTPCSRIEQVALGGNHSCVRMESGTVRCWGSNSSGQSSVPADLPAAASVSSGGSHTCALDESGGVHCWGSNSNGQSNVPGPRLR